MVSFDVKSLFTNVPLHETIDIIIKLMYSDQSKSMSLPQKDFKRLLELIFLDSYFLFDDKLYKQLDRVAMGSNLGPSFVNTFLGHLEHTTMF